MCGCFSHTPYWGPGLWPSHVPWLGIEPATLWFTACTQSTELQEPGLMSSFKFLFKGSWCYLSHPLTLTFQETTPRLPQGHWVRGSPKALEAQPMCRVELNQEKKRSGVKWREERERAHWTTTATITMGILRIYKFYSLKLCYVDSTPPHPRKNVWLQAALDFGIFRL